ncbi:hypothetical protein NPX13_g3431 [Xylaria arbuscula]|uniref:N-acetyltransferase domain-containing protein n=1 Tax=Xylaria arbuscula TaxID=114810 RepID=A0A9W8TQ37_9PEZI|nr:hypothetical protein NPX13_g3431 [Xylaria arbuscula]
MDNASPFARDAFEICSPRLIIRTAIERDAEDMRKFITNPENNPHTPTESNVTLESIRTRIRKWQELAAKGSKGFQVITLRSTGELIGYGGYNCFDLIEQLAETATPRYLTDIGVMIARSHWRKGYGLEAFCAFTEFAFASLGISRVRIETEITNEPWRRLMDNIGLGQFEEQQTVTYGEKSIGYAWHFEEAAWQSVKEDMQRRGKWPL